VPAAGVGRGRTRDPPAPAALILLSIQGMASACDDLGGIPSDDYHLARLIGTAALVLILLERVVATGQGKVGGEMT
jgi:NhaP-type Na+/H+ and K+/H+ antiporter